MLVIVDYISVLIYGLLIMVFFIDINLKRKNLLLLSLYVLFCALLQIQIYSVYDAKFIEKIYPLIIHLPLVVFFSLVLKKRLNLVLFALFTSYIFTAPRRWFGELFALFFNNNQYVLVASKIIVSIVLLIIIYKYLRPYVNRILRYSNNRINLLTIIPAISYIITYATTVYTDALYQSNMLVVGLFSVGFNSVFYLFIIAYFIEMDKSFDLQIEQAILKMQVDTTAIQIENYKKSQTQSAIYSHDLRHHLQFLSTSIAQNKIDEALNYISEIDESTKFDKVKQICENTSVNLILLAYEAKAKKFNIDICIRACVPTNIPMNSTDVCVILGNGIENATNACKILEQNRRKISVKCKFVNKKLMIEICNSFEDEIIFEDDIPVSYKLDHGLGVKSIVATVKKYQGVYSFTKDDENFTMRVIL